MPFVRIHHPQGKSSHYGVVLSQAVHEALISAFAIPREDFFQVVTQHEAGTELIGPAEFLGITHSADLIIVQITCAEGRTPDQKKALYEAIADNVSKDADVPRNDVIINLVETKRENWSFGDGAAQFS
ncbi:tautomerase family protein [Cohaesibacter gelatinilyticus]|uniref:Phenylpyruvate tautomerase PptA, 4-oxalocrotonate tautomerase family n=1 Tax=Cohaesibacter gelatinilyticus TaxID=372072 RepID=A0A285PC04_9HYPH|nr:tautomerase family protein [Cohaesibacter gelatinilyticus]SNZ19262.1 Phenylpyruvate tautomerase PptA, 4-oxalocrotonate tautomerase family [Cohaesibacter gelatinilyticus]HAT86971.1 tautomerase family protein [Hyphomicrobiales bacterium]